MENERQSARLGAWAGIVAVVLVIGGFAVGAAGGLPLVDLGSSQHDINKAFDDTAGTGAWIGLYLTVLGLLLVAVFAGRLWSHLRRAEGGTGWLSTTGLIAAIGSVVLGFVATAIQGVTAYRSGHEFSGQLALVTAEIGSAVYILSYALQALWLGCVAAVAHPTRALPRVLTWAAVVTTGIALIAVAAPKTTFTQLAGFLVPLWIVATSVSLLRRHQVDAASVATATT